jgi:hypothetical protein
MAFSSDSTRLASGGWQGDIKLWAVAIRPADAGMD